MKRTSFLLRALIIALIFLAAMISLSIGYPRQWHFHRAIVMLFNVGICLWLYIKYRRCKNPRQLFRILEERATVSDMETVTMTFIPLALGFVITFLPDPWSTGENIVIMTLVSLYGCRVLYDVVGKDLLHYVRGLSKKTKKAGILQSRLH